MLFGSASTDDKTQWKTAELEDCSVCRVGVKQLTVDLIECFNDREYDNLTIRHMSAEMKSDQQYLVATCATEFIEKHKRICATYPNYHVRVTDVTGDVDEVEGEARIWVTIDITGYAKDVKREGISQLYWRIRDGHWSCYRNKGLVLGGDGDESWLG